MHDSRPTLGRLLARHALWDEAQSTLWIDLTPFNAALQPVELPGWERMLIWRGDPPPLPTWAPLEWPHTPAVNSWRKQIPTWVIETLERLPTKGQLRLLYLSARYPQMLELLDKMPVLAWRLANAQLDEHQLQRLFPQPRTEMSALVGWPEDRHAVRFLQKLRLRRMDEQMLEQVETCLADPDIYLPASGLPRINSMALTLAAHFPQLIGSPLHQSLARQPCRPQQCKQMKALLSDAMALAQWLGKPIEAIQTCRFLVDVEALYEKWLQEGLQRLQRDTQKNHTKTVWKKVGDPPHLPRGWQSIQTLKGLVTCCRKTGHAWYADAHTLLIQPIAAKTPWTAALTHQNESWTVSCARQKGNQPLDPEQEAQLNLLISQLNQQR